jgi:hypothetical protein
MAPGETPRSRAVRVLPQPEKDTFPCTDNDANPDAWHAAVHTILTRLVEQRISKGNYPIFLSFQKRNAPQERGVGNDSPKIRECNIIMLLLIQTPLLSSGLRSS